MLRLYGAGSALALGRNVMQMQRQANQSSDWWRALVGMRSDMQGAEHGQDGAITGKICAAGASPQVERFAGSVASLRRLADLPGTALVSNKWR